MLLAPASGIAARLMVLFKPSALVLFVERVVSDAGRAFAGTTMCYAALADLYGGGPGLVPAVARCNSAMGVGMVLAPLLSSAVAWRGGGPRAVVATGAAVTLLQLVIEWRCLRETRSCQEDFKYSAVNPFGFVRLFLHGPKVRALSILLALHIAVDGKLLQDQISITQIVHAKWSLHQRSLWMSAFGAVMALGGQLTKPLLAWFGGEHAFASATHITSLVAFLLYSRGKFWLGLIPLILGQQRRTPTISWLLKEAEHMGVGRGEMLAMTANFRALVETVGPLFYGLVQRAADRRGMPSQVFLAPAFLVLLAEGARIAAARAKSEPASNSVA